MSTSEEWRKVPSLNGLLEVSSLGRVRRVSRPFSYSDGRKGTLAGGIMKGSISLQGYHMASFGNRKIAVHRLVAEAFLPTPDEQVVYQTVNHIDGDKLNNKPENLEWASYKHNNDHARSSGLNRQHGQNTNLSKYADQLVAALKRVNHEYAPSSAKLADLFDMSESNVKDILRGKSRRLA